MSDSYFSIFLIIVNLLLPAFFVYKCCLQKGMLEVNHVLLFSIGFLLYWILPIIVGALGYFRDLTPMWGWYDIYDAIPEATMLAYLLICATSYLAFVAGNAFAKRFLKPLEISELLPFDRRLINIFLVPAVVSAVVFAVLSRDELFKGYQDISSDGMGWRGSFTATSLILLGLAFINAAKLESGFVRPFPFSALLFNRFFVSYFVIATLVLSMGGRLYFLSSILMLIVYKTVYVRKIGVLNFSIFVLSVALMAGLMGLFRLGADVAVADIIINLFSEFLFTSFSLVHFLREGMLEWVNAPVFLASDFINLVPSVLFPSKASVLILPEEYGYTVFSPGGALNSFFSFMTNFGVLGTWCSLFFVGFFVSYLRKNSHLLLFKVMYVMLSGWLTFNFFRDPFSVSLVKTMFEFSILVPTIVIICMHIFSCFFSNKLKRL